jgi:hypothetical protein
MHAQGEGKTFERFAQEYADYTKRMTWTWFEQVKACIGGSKLYEHK